MKSALVALLVFVWMPFMLFKPHIGVLVWNWVSHMAPHSYTFGFAASFPFLMLVGGLTAAGMVFAREPKHFPGHPIVIAILTYFLWTVVTFVFAFEQSVGEEKIIQFTKVIVFALISMVVMQSPNRLKAFMYVMIASLLFISIKGGMFTIITGGSHRVQGAGGMMSDNNQLAMAMAMLFPLSIWLAQYPPYEIMKWPLRFAAFLVPVTAIGTQSRGGLVAISAVLFMLLLKSKRKFMLLAIMVPLAIGAVTFMPDSWKNRMQSTEDATEDDSFKGRMSMWRFATNVANDHPVEGGGYNVFYIPYLGPEYMPPGFEMRAPHSIYFEVLGEHGYVGLLLFLTMLFTGYYAAGTAAKMFRPYQETAWIAELSTAIQLSLIGFAVGGLTVNIATFDVFYHLLIVIVLCRVVGDKMVEKGVTNNAAKRQEQITTSGKWKPPAPSRQPPVPAERSLN